MAATRHLTLRGVRVHNLKAIDVTIPLGCLTIVTGVSGAGKSSLVFDTLYAEAQRRYLQSFSTYTRQFLERFDKPDADEISDLPPAVAIRSPSKTPSSRATVGSLTEISDHLRLLFARAGTLLCESCGQPVRAQRAADVLKSLLSLPAGTRCTIAFPETFEEEADQPARIASLLEEGYVRIQLGPTVYRLGEPPLPTFAPHDKIWVHLDRVEIGKTPPERLSESLETAFRRGQGRLGVLSDDGAAVFDQRYYCPRCDLIYPTPEPSQFDSNDHPVARVVHLGGWTIADWSEQALADLLPFVQGLQLADDPAAHAAVLLHEIQERLQTLVAMNLGYLTLQRAAATLSDGESRRIALTNALASTLVQVLYLLDEPSAGLHPNEIDALLAGLLQLRERGNTLVVIEHERRLIAAADHVIDLGPGAGEEGGEITYQGPPSGLALAAPHPTSDFWSKRCIIEIPTRRRQPSSFLKLSGAAVNNLQDLAVEIPLGVLGVVTGVSGAGKRSLVVETLYPALCHAKKKSPPPPACRLAGAHQVTDVLLLDQQPLPRSARSNPATYLKIFDEVRTLFAETVEARIRNYGPGSFSFNQPGGRCDTCAGEGVLTIDMRFLADVVTICPDCHGRRYRPEILAIKVRSLDIAEVLALTIREAFRFFRAQPKIEKKLKWLLDVGLDYVRLGQSLETFSGGECQRLKLASHLATSRKPGCLFLLVEPTAGLHPADVQNLLDCCERLLASGHSLLVLDNHLNIVSNADYVIDLGPESGRLGGRLVAQGTPEVIAQTAASATGHALQAWLKVHASPASTAEALR